MSKAKPAAAAGRKRRDRWGQRPVRNGRLRGQIRNVCRSVSVSPDGHPLVVYDFDLFVDDNQPLVPVRMSGTDFFNHPQDGEVVDLLDPHPQVRPAEPIRLQYPLHYHHVVVSLYPGRDDRPMLRQRMDGFLLTLGPILVVLIAVGTYFAIYR